MEKKIFGKDIYCCIPERIIDTKLLTDNEKKLYKLLCGRAEMQSKKFEMDALTQKELADEIDCSERTIRRALKKLIQYKLIKANYNPGFPSEYLILNAEESLIPVHESERKKKNKKIREALSKFKNIASEKKKEIITLTQNQSELKTYLESKIGIRVYNKQIIGLYNAAVDNKNINGSLDILKSIIDEKIDYIQKQKNKIIRNIIGYIYTSIKNYIPTITDEDKSSFYDDALSLSLKLRDEYDIRYHFTLNQCISLFSMVSKKIEYNQKNNQTIFNYIISEMVNKTKSRNDINDMFAYFRGMIKNYNKAKPKEKTENTKSIFENAYSEKWALLHSPTYSGRLPENYNERFKGTSYDLNEFTPLF